MKLRDLGALANPETERRGHRRRAPFNPFLRATLLDLLSPPRQRRLATRRPRGINHHRDEY